LVASITRAAVKSACFEVTRQQRAKWDLRATMSMARVRLVQVASAFATQDALRQLRRNAVIEVVLGIIIIWIVAVLGVTPHGSHHFFH
jgi:hypothetical protein